MSIYRINQYPLEIIKPYKRNLFIKIFRKFYIKALRFWKGPRISLKEKQKSELYILQQITNDINDIEDYVLKNYTDHKANIVNERLRSAYQTVDQTHKTIARIKTKLPIVPPPPVNIDE